MSIHSRANAKRMKVTLLTAILIISAISIIVPIETSASPGWLEGWGKRVKITIDHTDIDSDLDWFPVLVHLSSACGRARIGFPPTE